MTKILSTSDKIHIGIALLFGPIGWAAAYMIYINSEDEEAEDEKKQNRSINQEKS